jgi:hypothetical protein
MNRQSTAVSVSASDGESVDGGVTIVDSPGVAAKSGSTQSSPTIKKEKH